MSPLVKSLSRLCAILVFLTLGAGCARQVDIKSNVANGYNKKPHSILVFLPEGEFTTLAATNHNPVEAFVAPGFGEEFTKFATNCGMQTHTNLEAKKDGKLPVPDMLITTINPDWILSFDPMQAQTLQTTVYGSPVGLPTITAITYNITITDHADNKKVWRANATVPMGRSWLRGDDEKQPGRDTADSIIKQMQTDGLLVACQMPTK